MLAHHSFRRATRGTLFNSRDASCGVSHSCLRTTTLRCARRSPMNECRTKKAVNDMICAQYSSSQHACLAKGDSAESPGFPRHPDRPTLILGGGFRNPPGSLLFPFDPQPLFSPTTPF